MIKQALLLLVAAVLVASLPAEDLVSSPPVLSHPLRE